MFLFKWIWKFKASSSLLMTRILFFLILTFTLCYCATPISPDGGPRDETPPQLDTLNSTPNLQTNFTKQPIELTFDEWIILEDIFNQVVVSPPLEKKPTITLKRKTVRFEFAEEDTLRVPATYTINFGEAIKDLNEKNPTDNLRFVFSTGDFIDSLTVEGIIVDAFSGDPIEGALFMLYENLADSVVRTKKPFYFAKSNTSGRFKIENVKAGTFKGFALQDIDFNYLFNLPDENIAFVENTFEVDDSLPKPLRLRMFKEEAPLRVLDVDTSQYGQTKVVFNKKPVQVQFDFDALGSQSILEYDLDTVRIWYDTPEERGWNVYIQKDTFLNDTIWIPKLSKSSFLDKASLNSKGAAQSKSATRLNPDGTSRIAFNHPIQSFDTAQIKLLEDTLQTVVIPKLSIDTVNQKSLIVEFPWKEAMTYELQVFPGGVTDLFGLQNDTIIKKYQVMPRKGFGNINLKVEGFAPDSVYILKLMFDGENEVDQFRVSNTSTFTKNFTTLPPGNYSLQIILDFNDNGIWDPGNYDQKLQAEPVKFQTLEPLRANWDLDASVTILPGLLEQ